jgi:hypothetical protein
VFEEPQPTAGPGPAREGIYLFCFGHLPFTLAETDRGLDDSQPLIQWAFRRVAAVCCAVSLDDFCGPAAEARMREVAWVGPRALRHQQVVERVMRHSPVLPCRFGTLFSSLVPLASLLETHHLSIARFLNDVSNKEEWAVKGFVDPARAEAWLRATDPAFVERGQRLAEAPGRRYFQEKQLHADVRKQARSWARGAARLVHDAIAPWAVAVRSLPLATCAGSGRELFLNCSLLLRHDKVADFRACLERLNAEHTQRGVALELSGPWPPYSFSPSLPHGPESMDELPRLRHTP